MHIIVLKEKTREGDRSDNQKMQQEVQGALKEELKKNVISSIQYSVPGMYGKMNFIAYFFAFDKKYQSDLLSIKGSITNALKKSQIEHIAVMELKDYIDYFTDLLKANEKGGKDFSKGGKDGKDKDFKGGKGGEGEKGYSKKENPKK